MNRQEAQAARSAARELGLKRYVGLECPHGHQERLVSTNVCAECNVAKVSRAYHGDTNGYKTTQLERQTTEYVRPYVTKYLKTDKGRASAWKGQSKAIAKRALRIPGWYSEADEVVHRELRRMQQYLKEATGQMYHVDHVVPLCGTNVSGLHVKENWALIPAQANMIKGNSFDPELLD